MRRLSSALLAAVTTAAGLLTVVTPAAQAGTGSSMLSNPNFDNVASGRTDVSRCAPMTTRSFTGTITGADGMYPNATIGFDIKDKAGHNIDIADGCAKYGYSAIVQLNHYVGFEGAAPGTEMVNKATKYIPSTSQGTVTDQWALTDLPANAATVWIETYTREYTGSPCGLPCAGDVNTAKYGLDNRRAVPVSVGHVDLVLPMTPAYGGTTGRIQVKVLNHDGSPASLKKIYAWSMLKKDGSKQFQGWGMGGSEGHGVWIVPALAPGQKYVMWLYSPSGAVVARKKYVQVNARSTTKLTIRL